MLKTLRFNWFHVHLLVVFFISQTLYGQVFIYSSHDTYASVQDPDTNFGNSEILRVKKSNNGNTNRHGYLAFDLSSVSNTYSQVLLKLTSTNNSNISIVLESLSTSINENTITWNNQPTTSSSFNYGGLKENNVIYYDVTDFINDAILTTGEVNLLLYSQLATSPSQTFASNEAINIEDRPQLICYNSQVIDMPIFELKDTTVATVEEGNFTSIIMKSTNNYEDELDQYGGLVSCDVSYTATGFFRTEKIDDVWHLIDPEGNLFYMAGLNSVTEGGGVDLPNYLKDLGINTLGSWSDKAIENIAYCPELNIMRKFKNAREGDVEAAWDASIVPVFEPDFESFVIQEMPGWLANYKNDPYVIGYFTDNELTFSSTQLEKSLILDVTSDQFKRADQYMKDTYGAAYSPSQVTDADELNYVRIVAETYYSIVTSAIRNEDPNHLIVGSRINGNVRYRTPVIEVAGIYNDVLSINYYKEWTIQEADYLFWAEHIDIPWFTSEFYTKAQDIVGNLDSEGDPIDNADGAGWAVSTQQERALFFENYVIKTMRDPNCIGHHWFRYLDNNGSNKGILDAQYNAYPELEESFVQMNQGKYALRDRILHGYTDKTINCGTDDVNNADTVAVGSLDLYLVIGQSNTAGRATIEAKDNVALDGVFLYGEDGWLQATNPMNLYSNIRKSDFLQGLSYSYTFGRTIHQATGKEIGLVVNSRGGTNIESWTKGSPEGYYESSMLRLQEALATEGAVMKGILWHQGEGDRSDLNYFDAVGGDLVNLVNDFRTDLNIPDLPFIVGQLSYDKTMNANFNAKVLTVPSIISNAGYVTAECLGTTDGTHFDSNGQRVLGFRYASKILDMVYDFDIVTEKVWVSEDAYVRGGTNANNTYGTDATIEVKTNTNINNDRISFLKFDLEDINGQVIDANLVVHGEVSAGDNLIILDVFNTSTSWSENTITWNNMPALNDFIQEDSLKTTITEDFELCLSEFVEEEVLVTDELSFGFEGNRSRAERLLFISKEDATNFDKRAYLTVTHATSNVITSLTSPSGNEKFSNQLSIYPNPTSNTLMISSITKIKEVEMYNVYGEEVEAKVTTVDNYSTQLGIENLPQGTYIVVIEDENGNSKSELVVKN